MLNLRSGVTIAVGAMLSLLPGLSARAFSPDWAKPYLRLPTPTGAYIAKDDDWVALYREIDISCTQKGMLVTTFRLVLTPTAKGPTALALAMDYDSETEMLEAPDVWEPGILGYKQLSLRKASLDFPEVSSEMITSGRFHYVTTEKINPGKKAIVTWRVQERFPFPAEDIIWPFGTYPTADLVIRSDSTEGRGVHIVLVTPDGHGGSRTESGQVHLENLPALQHVYHPGIPWLRSPYQALPFVLATPRDKAGRSWADIASQADQLFNVSSKEAGAEALKEKAAALTSDKTDDASRIGALVHFVASLEYRDIQWGRGAYTPETPEETLRSLSGDCKAKALLLKVLLRDAGYSSNLVLCRSGGHYLSPHFSIPMATPFNHVVLAVKLPSGKKEPGTLTTGPGRGWVLVDPTDPQATFGIQPSGLEGASALWLASKGGDFFHIHTVKPAQSYVDALLSFTFDTAVKASFTLTMKGDGSLLEEIATNREVDGLETGLRRRCERYFQRAVPGIEVNSAVYRRGMRTAPRLELEGSIADPLQDIGGPSFTCSAPFAILGRALDVPASGYEITGDSTSPPPANPLSCSLQPDFQAVGIERSGAITFVLPDGWSVQSWPALQRKLDSPWLTLTIKSGNPWTILVSSPRGAFKGATEKTRLADLNRMASLFRQSCLIHESEPESPKRAISPPAER